MGRLKASIFFLFVGLILGCGKEEAGLVDFKMATKKSFLIPAKTNSCKELQVGPINSYSIGEKYFSFFKPQVEWKGDAAYPNSYLSVIAIVARIKSPFISGGSHSCIITGQDLKYLYFNPLGSGNDPGTECERNGGTCTSGTCSGASGSCSIDPDSKKYWWDPTQVTSSKGTSYYLDNNFQDCPFMCGGIQTVTSDMAFTATVSFELTGVINTTNDEGVTTEVPIKATTTGTIQNLF
jgi:hypothetical protein